jgi:hypothetical protein
LEFAHNGKFHAHSSFFMLQNLTTQQKVVNENESEKENFYGKKNVENLRSCGG